MTNKEALIATLMVGISDLTAEKALVDGGLNPSDEYSVNNTKTVDLAAIEVLKGLLSTPDVSEGDYSVKYDRKAVQARLALLNEKHFPETITEPTITGVSVW